jgi:phytoene/squalene synthetase
VANMQRVINVTTALSEPQRMAILRCVELMCYGMPRFQSTASLKGLQRLTDLDEYCYYVAGVVGDMLTELFCAYSADMAKNRTAMQALAVSFAQGLQMTNILKDVWEDRSRGACWLPQEVFSRHGVDLARLAPDPYDPRFAAGMRELVGVAHGHLRNALEYTLLIPGHEAGIRRFCLWAIGLAVLTLQKINRNPGFTAGVQVKVSRKAVAMTRISTDIALRNDWLLRRLFAFAARGLPLAVVGETRRPVMTSEPVVRAGTRARFAPFDGEFGNMSRAAEKAAAKVGPAARSDILSHTLARSPALSALDRAVFDARDALVARQSAQGYWLFELEADCTIPAEYIMMMHYLDEIDPVLEKKLAVYLRSHQADHGGWPLYHGGDLNISCTVKRITR